MGREGGRTGRTHLMVGATGLSMAETLTVAAMHNAVELSAMKSFDVAPEEQQQECHELERRRGRAKWEFGAIQARGAALRTSILVQMMDKRRASPERRAIGSQVRLRAWSSERLPAPALTARGVAQRRRRRKKPRAIPAVRVGRRHGCRVKRGVLVRSFGL